MFRMLGAAVAALVLSVAGSASAAVLYTQAGNTADGSFVLGSSILNQYIAANGGEVEVKVNFTAPGGDDALLAIQYELIRHHPMGWIEHDFWFDELLPSPGAGTRRDWDWVAGPGTATIRFRNSGYACEDVQIDEFCRWEDNPQLLFLYPGQPAASYELTISSIEPSAVPEPATWAMMIAGFGLIGAVLRRPNRRRYAPLRFPQGF